MWLCFPSSLLTRVSAFGPWLQSFFTHESGRSGIQQCDLPEALSVALLITLILLVIELWALLRELIQSSNKWTSCSYQEQVHNCNNSAKTANHSDGSKDISDFFWGKWPQYFFSFRWQYMTSFSQLLLLGPVPHLQFLLRLWIRSAALPRLSHQQRPLLFQCVESQLLVGKPGPWRPDGYIYLDIFALQRMTT